MRRDLIIGVRTVLVMTVLVGLIYPFAIWAVGQVAFHGRANGSQIHVDGRLAGSRLLGQDFSKQLADFQERPSQDSYDSAATFFSNRGPNSSSGVYFYRDQLASYLKREQPYMPGLTASQVPVDAVTTSASGVDPHISVANARIQAHRIAAKRGLSLAEVNKLIDENTDDRFLGVLGEPGVNVVDLNLALNQKAPLQ